MIFVFPKCLFYRDNFIPISLENKPESISFNSKTHLAYITYSESNNISILDINNTSINKLLSPSKTLANISSIKAGQNPYKIAINTHTNRLFVTDSVLNTISITNSETDQIIDKFTVGGHLYDIDVNPNTDMIYATDSTSKSLFIINGEDISDIKNITVGDYPADIAVDSDKNIIYVIEADRCGDLSREDYPICNRWKYKYSEWSYILVFDF